MATARFKAVTSRTFNYLIELYLDKYFRKHSIYRNPKSMKLIIDERSVATELKYTLREYLNTNLNISTLFCEEDIQVEYHDSKNFLMLQFTDFVANTVYRSVQKKDNTAKDNIDLIKTNLCGGNYFRFPMN